MKSEISSTRSVLVLCASLVWACEAETGDSYFDENVPGADGGGHTDDGGGDAGGTDTGTEDDGGSDDGGTGDDGTGSDTNTRPDVNECGDGILGDEEVCDGELFGNETCQSNGWESGELACNAFCTGFSTHGCYTCGNATVEGPETCDGDIGDETCEDQGFTEGELTCNVETCELDTSGCTLCGDGTAEGNEECDTDDLDSQTCESLGYIEGTLACDEECLFDKSACLSDDYTQDFESGSLGPEWTLSGSANWFASTTTPINGSYSAQSGSIMDGQYTDLSLTLEYNIDGDISFWHKESSESGYDYLIFYVDDVQQDSWAGINVQTQATYLVTAGTHTFRWRYDKDDICCTGGTDTVWIDDIYATGGKVP
jgi:hypothetical protein